MECLCDAWVGARGDRFEHVACEVEIDVRDLTACFSLAIPA